MLNLILFFIRKFDRNLNTIFYKDYFSKNQDGFTLVELIVVVVIIGILSSIAIPSFQDSTKKARQSGVAAQISSYLKAAQSFYAEYGVLPRNAGDLGNYINVIECRYHLISKCKGQKNHQRNIAVDAPTATVWNSTSGMYTITIGTTWKNTLAINARAQRQDSNSSLLSNDDYGVSSCFNAENGATSIVLWKEKGYQKVLNLRC